MKNRRNQSVRLSLKTSLRREQKSLNADRWFDDFSSPSPPHPLMNAFFFSYYLVPRVCDMFMQQSSLWLASHCWNYKTCSFKTWKKNGICCIAFSLWAMQLKDKGLVLIIFIQNTNENLEHYGKWVPKLGTSGGWGRKIKGMGGWGAGMEKQNEMLFSSKGEDLLGLVLHILKMPFLPENIFSAIIINYMDLYSTNV